MKVCSSTLLAPPASLSCVPVLLAFAKKFLGAAEVLPSNVEFLVGVP